MTRPLHDIRGKIVSGSRLTRDDALWLIGHATDSELSELATIVKKRFHSDKIATYLIMAIVNYTNVCVAKCDYCAFYKLPHQSGTYLLTFEQIREKIDALVAFGGTLVSFNGGFHPRLRLQDYADLFAKVRNHYGNRLEFFEMTVAEFMFSCKLSKVSYAEGVEILKGAGTRWITGGGAEILDDAFRRRHSPGKFTVDDYFCAQQAIVDGGLGSTATQVIGFDETLDERLNHLERLRDFQDGLRNKLPSFLCWTYKPWNNELGGSEISKQEYLRWLAVCRVFLDNFLHIRTSVLTMNEGALAGLDFGADDFDLPTEDEVTEKAGATITHDFQRIISAGEQLGYKIEHRKPFAMKMTDSQDR